MAKNTKLGIDPNTKKIFSEGEVGVLLEDIDQKLGLLAEGQQTIQHQISSMAQGQEKLAKRMDRAEVRLDAVEVSRS
ncbi:MAG: hypothetical protein WD898_03180 [Candidatus Paceibacterota bacterium]